MPILGICRGAQLLNVARQGTLHQHVPEFTNGTVEHRQAEIGTRTSHEVRVAPDSSLAQTTGGGPVKVNSFHHQAIDRIGFDLRAVAWSEDGLIEAIEEQDGRFVLGVQWHAETLVADAEQLSLFERLVEATRHPGQAAPRERLGDRGAGASSLGRRRSRRAGGLRCTRSLGPRRTPTSAAGGAIGAIASPADAGALMPADTRPRARRVVALVARRRAVGRGRSASRRRSCCSTRTAGRSPRMPTR